MRIKYLLPVLCLMTSIAVQAQINIAGVYEGDMKDNITRKRIYANLDFINEVPDFTQIFTTKEAPLKILPKDFMNAKKLKKNFVGQKAPGFIRFNSKTLFSSTEEIKLTNPRLEDGVLTADWVNNEGTTGRCFIIVNPDNTIQFLGLTSMDVDLGPDNLIINRVENKLPEDVEPYVTDPAKLPLINKRYCREILWKLRIDDSKGLRGVTPSVDLTQVRRIGDNILLPVQFRNSAPKEARPYFGMHNPFERNNLAAVNGMPYWVKSADQNLEKSIGANETAMQPFEVVGVPLDAQKIDNLKIGGRAQYTHSTEKNPYGDFEYRLIDIVLPELLPSNREGVYITDSDIQVIFDGVTTEGKNLIINFTLVNRSNRSKSLAVNDKAIARAMNGEEYRCTAVIPSALDGNDMVKGKLVIQDAASTNIRMARIPINISERTLSYQAVLHLQ